MIQATSLFNSTLIQKTKCNHKNNINFRGAFGSVKTRHNVNNYKACFLGGAIGDALGAPVEFLKLTIIKAKYGIEGIKDLTKNIFGKAAITDDTQMTIFTTDGLIRSLIKNPNLNIIPNMQTLFKSYQTWLFTQGYRKYPKQDGWIPDLKELYVQRAPGDTCVRSILKRQMGNTSSPLNKSRECGGVMRVAPIGLAYYKTPELAFKIGAECAALTHGHPDAYLSAGLHSSIIANIIQGKSIEKSIDEALIILKKYNGHEKTLEQVLKAKELSQKDINPEKAIEMIGEGWSGDEAIAISIYCVLKSPNDIKKALTMAVNHNGDSDSVGAIVGNIMGGALGLEKIPPEWIRIVELSKELQQIAQDLYYLPGNIQDIAKRYPIS